MRAAILCLTLLLTACGFQLRGAYNLPYESLFISLPDASVIGAGLKRQIRAGGGTRLVDTMEEAQGTFLQVTEVRERQILSLSSAGRVREVRLRFRYAYRVVDAKGRELVPTTGVELTRDISYDDSAVLAKEQEEQLLWRDMENDLVQQLLRRLTAVKPSPPKEAD
ncbi:MAG: LPS-assembly lipoprotein [Pseudomonadota bacterium]|nr:LPS-assembly lipoprotein [Pseudomonadota bacterium]MDQ5907197.1 LPS-assembly lipoprotein [Pseudomonadota bacterium]MDQ5914440.1 LPS-assembly lipoprotein [Pseudomonadota bacterium]MDQ5919249.1 LPS-assembly lipoprotein [Pseudomonadota bacterium]